MSELSQLQRGTRAEPGQLDLADARQGSSRYDRAQAQRQGRSGSMTERYESDRGRGIDRQPPASLDLEPNEKISKIGQTNKDNSITLPDGTNLAIPAGSTIALVTRTDENGLYGSRLILKTPDGTQQDLPVAGFGGHIAQDSKLLGIQTSGEPQYISFIEKKGGDVVKFEGALTTPLKDLEPFRKFITDKLAASDQPLKLGDLDPETDPEFRDALQAALKFPDGATVKNLGVANNDRSGGQMLVLQIDNRRVSVPLPSLDRINSDVAVTKLEDELLKLENLNNGEPFNPVEIMREYQNSRIPENIKKEELRQVMLVIARREAGSPGSHTQKIIDIANQLKDAGQVSAQDVSDLSEFLRSGLDLTRR